MALGVRVGLVVAFAAIACGIDERKNCYITGSPPEKPRSLSFCHKFNNEACCPPAMDDEVNDMFSTITNLGLSCRMRGDVREHPLARLYCMTCDPKQPKYVRMEPYLPIPSGGTTQWTDMDDICSPAAPDCNYDFSGFPDVTPVPRQKREKTILICKKWADEQFGSDSEPSTLLTVFSDCGILKSSRCLDAAGEIIPDRDRYVCGDDLIIPHTAYESVEEFLNAESLGPPQLDEAFGFKIVENRPCEVADLADTDPVTVRGYNKFNPNCLRTAAQLAAPNSHSEYSSAGVSPTYPEALGPEECFNSGAALVPNVLVVLVSVTLALALLLL